MLFAPPPITGDQTGYSQACWNYLMSLYTAGFRDLDLFPVGALDWRDVPLWAHPIRSQTNSDKRSPIVIHGDPLQPSKVVLGGAPRLLLTVFETTRLPKRNIDHLHQWTDGVITASEFNRQGLADSGYAKPIHLVPHTEGRWWWEKAPARTITDRFVFTYVGTMNQRKNPLGALAAYKAAFPEERADTAFALKTFATNEDQIKALEDATEGRNDIWIWNDLWRESKIQWLHANTDVFVSAHYGEGWGVGPFKAKLLGKRVIYTDFSAVQEFLSPEHDFPVEYDLIDIPRWSGESYCLTEPDESPLQWAKPRFDALVEAFRTARKVESPTPEAHVRALRERFEWGSVGRQFIEVIDKYPG
jgi:glycosyltransferase involved in cell wall biosynthesis